MPIMDWRSSNLHNDSAVEKRAYFYFKVEKLFFWCLSRDTNKLVFRDKVEVICIVFSRPVESHIAKKFVRNKYSLSALEFWKSKYFNSRPVWIS